MARATRSSKNAQSSSRSSTQQSSTSSTSSSTTTSIPSCSENIFFLMEVGNLLIVFVKLFLSTFFYTAETVPAPVVPAPVVPAPVVPAPVVPARTPSIPAPTAAATTTNDTADSDHGSIDDETGDQDEFFEFPSVENKLNTFDSLPISKRSKRILSEAADLPFDDVSNLCY